MNLHREKSLSGEGKKKRRNDNEALNPYGVENLSGVLKRETMAKP